LILVDSIAKAVQAVFTFGGIMADSEQKRERLFVGQYKRLLKACNIAEKIFALVDEMLIDKVDVNDEIVRKFILEYKKLRGNFDSLD